MLPIALLFAGSAVGGYAGIKAYKKIIVEKSQAFFSSADKQALEPQTKKIITVTSDNKDEISQQEQETNHYLSVSSVALGFASAGALFFPPLTLLSVPISIYAALPIFKAAYKGITEEHKLKVVILDSVAITGGFVTGYYFIMAFASFIYFLAAKLLDKTRDTTRKNLVNIFSEQPRFVWVLKNGVEIETSFDDLQVGDIVVVNAGEIIPVDGIITKGMATIDQQALTGEAQPYEKVVGEQVLAASIVLSGQIHIKVEKAGVETIAAQIGEVLNRTAEFEMSLQTRNDKMSEKTVVPTLATSAVALSTLGASSAVAVLSSNYSEIIRITTSMGMLNFINLASKKGILIKDGRSLELLNQIDTVVFDKTGTLTLEQPHLSQISICNGVKENEVLTYAAAAEHKQNHPIARAILQAANERSLELPEIDDSQYEIGYGIKVKINDQIIQVGSYRFMEAEEIAIPVEILTLQKNSHEQGYSTVYVARDKQLVGMLELHPTIRPEAKEIIQQLQQRNLSTYIISGDHEQPTKQLADFVGIDNYFANTLPQDKANLIMQLQQEGKSVCFIGDGINDSIALKKAEVSISLRGASTVATDTAQIILMDKNLTQLANLFEHAKLFKKNQKNSFASAFVPGVMSVGGIFFLHFGVLSALMLYNVSLFGGVGNALLPLIKKQR
ncbi:MAG: heavy metal translocating P-type ATPase [Pseudomonadota bacterium]